MPKILAVVGEPGTGKSTGIASLVDTAKGIFIYSDPYMSALDLINQLNLMLGLNTSAWLFAAKLTLETNLKESPPHLIVVDEAHHLSYKAIEYLRSLSDRFDTRIAIVTTPNHWQSISKSPQLKSRIVRIESSFNARDALKLATELSDAILSPEILSQLFRESDGSIRNFLMGLVKIEAYAIQQKLRTIGLEEWGVKKII
jgi:DNA transposition AAA+ family ATPase